MNSLHGIMAALLGEHRYRVKFTYKIAGHEVFSFASTVKLVDRRRIEDHRLLKRARGPLSSIGGVPKSALMNGTLEVEPVCYLGRWRGK